MKLFPGQPFPKDYDRFLDYKAARKKKNQWFVASLFGGTTAQKPLIYSQD